MQGRSWLRREIDMKEPTSKKMARWRDEEFMTVKEVAELLRVHRSTIYRMARRGDLRFYSDRRHLYFRRKDVRAFLKKHHGGEGPN